MSIGSTLQGLPRLARFSLVTGMVLLLIAFGGGSWLLGLAGIGLLAAVVWTAYAEHRAATRGPWPWPPDFRALAEALARPIDPTPERFLPPHEGAGAIAHVATDAEGLTRLLADKPPAWKWAAFTSVLVQRRNAVQARLRRVVSGYQPGPGRIQLSSRAYAATAYHAMSTLADLVGQLEQFMLSPAFTGVLINSGIDPDAEAVISLANRLMDYHDEFLAQAECLLQTPVELDAQVFVQDAGTCALYPLVGYQRFITTMCARIGEAQDLLPYTDGESVIELDNVQLVMDMSDELGKRFFAHYRRFNT